MNKTKLETVLIIGPSGGGKDTQANIIHNDFGFEHIGTGNMFRQLQESGDPKGIEAAKVIKDGKFLNSTSVFELLEEWVKQYDPAKPWVFVSAVRLPDQVELFDKLLAKYGRKLELVILLQIDEESAKERMRSRLICPTCSLTYSFEQLQKAELTCPNDKTPLERRIDDINEQALTNRFEEYYANMRPIIAEYQGRGIMKLIDGRGSIESVAKIIRNLLTER